MPNATPHDAAPRARGILLSAEMVRAVLAGRKTQTRRVIVPQPPAVGALPRGSAFAVAGRDYRSPYGVPGDRLYVRETWAPHPDGAHDGTIYRATDPGWDAEDCGVRWRPSIHMPRRLSRLTLRVTNIGVERVQSISEADARAEGCPPPDPGAFVAWKPVPWFRLVWDRLNAARGYGWDANPWVWRLTFAVEAPADAPPE